MRLNGTTELVEPCSYPATMADVLETVGDAEVDLPMGTERVAEAIERGGGDVFETAEDAHLAIYQGVSVRAVGRPRYDERGGNSVGETEVSPPLSF